MGYEEKTTQEQTVLNVLKKGESITQIDLNRYYELMNGNHKYISPYVDAIALGIANLPARIWGLKKKGWNILTKDVKTKNSHFAVYSLAE